MKTFIYFIFTCLISIGALYGAWSATYPFPLYLVAFGIWAIFIWYFSKRIKKKAERREMEKYFRNYMRHQSRNFKP
jgi:phosphatidylglycerophosphate synthase